MAGRRERVVADDDLVARRDPSDQPRGAGPSRSCSSPARAGAGDLCELGLERPARGAGPGQPSGLEDLPDGVEFLLADGGCPEGYGAFIALLRGWCGSMPARRRPGRAPHGSDDVDGAAACVIARSPDVLAQDADADQDHASDDEDEAGQHATGAGRLEEREHQGEQQQDPDDRAGDQSAPGHPLDGSVGELDERVDDQLHLALGRPLADAVWAGELLEVDAALIEPDPRRHGEDVAIQLGHPVEGIQRRRAIRICDGPSAG